ncbi:MAG: hypothetical protein Q9182_006143 [Xanthomendoza sp. 2 TL-2023]
MLRASPTQIRLTMYEYHNPSRRREIFTTGYAYETHWTRDMLLRLKELDTKGLSEKAILATFQKDFGGPKALEEIWQERAFLAMGPKDDGTWNIAMEKKVVMLANSGKDTMEITRELHRVYQRPGAWAETYRKIQELKLNGRIL